LFSWRARKKFFKKFFVVIINRKFVGEC